MQGTCGTAPNNPVVLVIISFKKMPGLGVLACSTDTDLNYGISISSFILEPITTFLKVQNWQLGTKLLSFLNMETPANQFQDESGIGQSYLPFFHHILG